MSYKKENSQKKCPVDHIGIIMDGNGRWAKKRLMPRTFGHKSGARAFRDIAEHCRLIGLKHLTVYAFSTENWKRPKQEIDAIMNLLREYLKEVFSDREQYIKKNMRVRFIGKIEELDMDIIDGINEIENTTKDMTGLNLNVAVNYGGRNDIVLAVQKISEQIKNGTMEPYSITEKTISENLYTAGQPDPDIIIRTGGESRLSNFLTWQSAYSEYMYTDTLWPDFKPRELDNILDEFYKRERRFGGI